MHESHFSSELNTPYALSDTQIAQFQQNGFIKLKQVFSPDLLDYYGTEITRQVFRLNNQTKPMDERTTYEKAFLQIHNL